MFAAAERLNLEAIVAKRKADPYNARVTWYKIKSRTYTLRVRVGGSCSGLHITVNRTAKQTPCARHAGEGAAC
jgi:hypothetical protein